MSSNEEAEHMRRALTLAERGWGRVHPNPLVGAVVVRDGTIVGEGAHVDWGGAHAEIVALREAGDRARRGDLYVNLEPCHHTGKTGPCSTAIAEAGVRRVVYAMADPNPRARGGASWLRDQGIDVVGGRCEEDARELNAAHVVNHRLGRPLIALKYAISIDARLSERPGAPVQLTEGEAVREAHRLRAGHDSIMVGSGTVVADDPELTVRDWEPPRKPPIRIVLDTTLRISADARLLRTVDAAPVWIFAAEDAPAAPADVLRSSGAEVLRVARGAESGLDIGAVVRTLWARGVRSILCEGGGVLGSALLREGWIDRLYLFVAPRWFGSPGVAAFQGARGQAPRDWKLVARRELGPTTLLVLGAGTAAGGD